MARSRNLKPSFFTNDKLAEVDPLGRLLFAGLWTIADREGRLEDRPKRIKAELLPYDDGANVDRLLADLQTHGFVLRYVAGGAAFIQILAFTKHQDPHYKEKASEIPAPPGVADSGVTPGGVSEEVRQRVFDRDGRRCVSCTSADDLSLDHIVPRSAGGSHDEANLQTLCRRCNSGKNNRQAKAIVGQSSAKDGPTLVVASGHLPPLIPDSGFPQPDSLVLIPDPPSPMVPAHPAKKPRGDAAAIEEQRQEQTRAVWQSYASAYEGRYGAEPVRNAKVNACVVGFLKRVPADEAPHIAAHYVRNNASFYVSRGHDFSHLLADAEKLRTEWATGNRVTATQARQADRTQANGNVFGNLIAQEKDGTHG